MPFCSSCGRPLTGEGRFCAACGAPQAAAEPSAAPGEVPSAAVPAPSWPVGEAPPPAVAPRRPFPGWAVVLFVLGVLAVAGVVAALVVPLLLMGGVVTAVDKLAPGAVEKLVPTGLPAVDVPVGVLEIQAGIEQWRVDHDSALYPPSAEVTPERLGEYVDPWPQNPYAGSPMLPTGAPGDFTYVRAANGLSYELTGYGEDGTPVLTVP